MFLFNIPQFNNWILLHSGRLMCHLFLCIDILGPILLGSSIDLENINLDLSQKKQLIMCFTPDEFSDNIKPIFSKIDKRELRLGDDEKTIETGLVR